jgi:regulator of protease activity HflC (stomatin/prohibitin superfamily)
MEAFFILLVIILIILVVVLSVSIKIVKQQTAYTVETFGKFSRVIYPGINLVIPFVENTARKINLSTLNLDFSILAITLDKVNISIDCTLIYKVIYSKVYQATYSLDNPTASIKALVENTVRAFVATQTHEQVIQSRDEMTNFLITHLIKKLEEFGFAIDSFQVRDIILPREITDAMSRVISSRRNQEAAVAEAEARYILAVKEAEGLKETRRLQGEGLAAERDAIIKGLAHSVQEMQQATGATPMQVMNIVMANNYNDTLRTITNDKNGNTKTVFINSSPNAMTDIIAQLSSLQR